MSEDTRFSLDEPRIVEGPASWLEANRKAVLAAVVLLLLAGIGAGWWWQQRAAQDAEASKRFAEATKPEDWKQVAEGFSGTSSAPLALLQLAQEARERNALDEAMTWTEQFLSRHPSHPLAPATELSRALLWEAQGKTEEARSAFEAIAAAEPAHPFAGAAAVGRARLLVAEGKATAARQILSEFIGDDRGSAFASEAARMLRTLPEAESAPSAPPAP